MAKNGHAEVLGLVGQTTGKAIVIEKQEEARKLDSAKTSVSTPDHKVSGRIQNIVKYIEGHNLTESHFESYRHYHADKVAKPDT